MKTLKELEEEWPGLKVPIIVHDMPNSIGMATWLARKFEFKFILAWTTENGGLVPPYWGRPKHSGGRSSW